MSEKLLECIKENIKEHFIHFLKLDDIVISSTTEDEKLDCRKTYFFKYSTDENDIINYNPYDDDTMNNLRDEDKELFNTYFYINATVYIIIKIRRDDISYYIKEIKDIKVISYEMEWEDDIDDMINNNYLNEHFPGVDFDKIYNIEKPSCIEVNYQV